MKITISSIALLLLFSLASYAQSNYSIKGSVVDTAEKKLLSNASIMVLNAKDSILRKFTRVTADGSFAINDLGKGKFILIMTYPGYADYSEGFTLDEKVQLPHDFGKVNMILKARLLQDVIIKGQATAIKIKGDTTEFNAKAYVIQPNDRVEDLIKQFPGIEVDKDGKITAQGKTVEKVLVDGEEFFGDDPTLVTKNIRADMVDKVQLYDKKSDQATFTGIDDGIKTKTLNIKLKEDKKDGYFGKLDAGIGTGGFYQGQGMYNKFTAKQKFSAYTTDGNTGKTGLGWQDSQKYSDSGGLTFDDNGGASFNFSGGDNGLDSFDGRYDGHGMPKAITGGVHYDSKWSKDNQTINANYKIGQLDVNGTSNTQTQNNSSKGEINSNANQNFNNSMFRQKLDLTYVVKFDTTSTLKIAVDGTYRHGKTANDYLTIGRAGPINNDTLLYRNIRTVTNDDNTHIFNASAFYTKKLKKKGRTLSVLFSEAINNNNSKGFLHSEADYYNTHTGATDSTHFIDQLKSNSVRNTVFNSNITYTEPISKTISLIINYGLNFNNGSADRRSYNQSPQNINVYNVLDTTVSNFYKLDQVTNGAGAIINYKKGKHTLNFGTKVADVSFKQEDEHTGGIFERHFVNWSPQATYQYRFSQQTSLYLYYNGNTTQPTINQIQPVKVNTDPFNIFLGNRDLRPSFRNNVNLYYNDYKVLTNQYIFIGGGYGFTSGQIVTTTTTNAGKSTIQYINLTGKTPVNFNLYTQFGRKINLADINVGINASVNGNTSYSYTNSALTYSNNTTYSGGLSINKYVKDKFDFYVNTGPSYTISGSSLQTGLNNNGSGFRTNANFDIYLPFKFQLSSNLNYTYAAPTPTFNSDLKRTLLNASLSKSFFKSNELKFTLAGNDLLNQNIGFSRQAYGNLVTQNTYTTIQRYFMFSVTWDFNKMGGPTVNK
jgi:hypothetical protein